MSDGSCKWCTAALYRLEQAERHAIAGVKPGPVLGTKRGRSSKRKRAHHRMEAIKWLQLAMECLQTRAET